MRDCGQELCGNWSGDGSVCPCVLFDIDPADRPIEPSIEDVEDVTDGG